MPLSPEDQRALQDEIAQTNSPDAKLPSVPGPTPTPSSYPPPQPDSPAGASAPAPGLDDYQKALAQEQAVAAEPALPEAHGHIRKFLEGLGGILTLQGPNQAIRQSQQADNEAYTADRQRRLKAAQESEAAAKEKMGLPAAALASQVAEGAQKEALGAQRPGSPESQAAGRVAKDLLGDTEDKLKFETMSATQIRSLFGDKMAPLFERKYAVAMKAATAASNNQYKQDQNAAKQDEVINKHVETAQNKLKSFKPYVDAVSGVQAADDVLGSIEQAKKNPQATDPLKASMARMAAHGQRMNQAEFAMFGGSPQLGDALSRAASRAGTGKWTPQDLAGFEALAHQYKSTAINARLAREREAAKQLAQVARKNGAVMSPDDAYGRLTGESAQVDLGPQGIGQTSTGFRFK